MLFAFIGLVLAFLAIGATIALVRCFMAWLRRGRPLHSAVGSSRLDEETARSTVLQNEVFACMNPVGLVWRLSGNKPEGSFAAVAEARDEYLDGMSLGWYQIVIIFLMGSMAGLVLEEVWMYVTAGLTESRVGLVWGPFSPLYGCGAVLFTLITWTLRRQKVSDVAVFVVAALLGGTLEQLTGWTMATLFNIESWSYLALPDHITQWVAWRFLLFWGIIGLVWYKAVMPDLLFCIGMPTTHRQVLFVALLTLYLTLDIAMTVICFARMNAREAGVPPQTALDVWVDNNFDDRFIESTFQNLVINGNKGKKKD